MARRRNLASLALATLAAVTLTAFVVSASPGSFLDTTTPDGEPNIDVGPPGGVKLGILLTLFSATFAGAFLLLVRSAHFPLIASVILIGAVQGGAYVSFAFWTYHEEPEFCAQSCHVMEPVYESFAAPGPNDVMRAHQTNETALCLDCHSAEGIGGQIELMQNSLRHVLVYASGSYDVEALGKGTPVLTVPDENCLKCHEEDGPSPLPPEHESFQEDCAYCHNPHARNGTGTDIPKLVFEPKACAECHEDAAKRLQAPPAKHAEVEDGDCRGCHVTHANRTDVPGSTLACDDSGCHDQDIANNLSLAARDHPSFTDRLACADCHGGAHNLTAPPFEALLEGCTDCHSAENRDMRASLTKHGDLLDAEGCDACHVDHEQPPPDACTGSGCHDQDVANAASLAKLDHAPFDDGTRACADCHGGAHNLTRPPMQLLASACAECHEAPAERIQQRLDGHADLANRDQGCVGCHTDHDPPTTPGCDDAGCHDDAASNPASLPALGHADFESEACADCHGSAHELRAPPMEELAKSCDDCHAAAARTLARQSAHVGIAQREGCDGCHVSHTLDAVKGCDDAGCHDEAKPGARVPDGHERIEGVACADCHGSAHNLTRAPSFERFAPYCAECHQERASKLPIAAPAHAELAEREGCDACHVAHGPAGGATGSVRSCDDAGCHDQNPANPVSLAANGHRGEAIARCADCHGGAHDLKSLEFGDLASACADCHAERAMPSSTPTHADLAAEEGCTACHERHEGGAVKTCTDAGCHDQNALNPVSMPAFAHPAPSGVACETCHDTAHRLKAPDLASIEPYCASCHAAASADVRASPTAHGALARAGECSDCHVRHDEAPRTCTDAGCHDANAANPASLDPSKHPLSPAGRACKDCHDDAHDVRIPSFASMEPYCDDCHRQEASRLLGRASAHADIARETGCDTCHVSHDPGAVRSCSDSGCHDANPANPASLPAKDHAALGSCGDCHGVAHATRMPSFANMTAACDRCHVEPAQRIASQGLEHGRVAAEGCDGCHTSHDRDDVKGCLSGGCHDADPANPASLASLGHKPFTSEASCAQCHEGGHTLRIPTAEQLRSSCGDCHTRTLAPLEPHTAGGVIEPTACGDCHTSAGAGAGAAAAMQKGDHAAAGCIGCHYENNTVGAPLPSYSAPSNVSQVAWQRLNKARFAQWVEGRGNHEPGSDCTDCHQFHESAKPVYPPGACEGCHTWLGDIDQEGFQNVDPERQGETRYTGPISPQALLQRSKDLDGDGRDHKAVYERWGCSGFCHNPAMTVDIAEKWSVAMGALSQESVDPVGLPPGTEHGYINRCTDCHYVRSPVPNPERAAAGEAPDLHATHIVFVSAERPLGDEVGGDRPVNACTYCHYTGYGDPAKQYGGCYNCHLSGHLPETFYWGALPEAENRPAPRPTRRSYPRRATIDRGGMGARGGATSLDGAAIAG